MKKKLLIGSVAILFLMIGVLGTVAYFVLNFDSDNNTAKAAVFDVEAVNTEGETIGDGQFDLDEDLVPGMETLEAYRFDIERNNTELPVEYSVSLTPSGDLFPGDGSSPVVLSLQRSVNGEWTEVKLGRTFTPVDDTENFKVLVDWPHGENDIDFQGKTGNIHLEVVATQVDTSEEVEGPPYYTGEVKFKATPNGSTRTTSDKEVNFYVNDDGYKVIEVTMGDGKGAFEEKVGNFKVVEEIFNGKPYFRVYTDNEYFATESQAWRTSTDKVDTTVEGTVRFDKILGPYLSIESDVLYDWFTSK